MKFTKITWGIVLLFICATAFSQKRSVIVDADTGNEVDDLYAVSRILLEPGLDIKSLNATQWQASHWTIPNSMENSYRLNQVIASYIGTNVKLLRGGVDRMYDWGNQAQHSAAAYEIIAQARQHSSNNKLAIVALGALTNVASAIYIAPDIQANIELYWLGGIYNFEDNVLSRTEFNCVMDVQAMDIMLNSQVAMHIMPVNVAKDMVLNYPECQQRLETGHDLGRLLVERWFRHLDPSRSNRIIWDLALVEAFLSPEMATEVTVKTSKESGNREINFYNSINADKMEEKFFAVMDNFFNQQ